MGRTILGLLAGVVAMWLTISGIELGMRALYPPPPGLDANDPAQLARIVEAMPPAALAMLVLGWTMGGLVGGAVAARIARHPRAAAVVVGLLVVAGVVAMMVLLPAHPRWVGIAGLLLPVPAALAGARIARRRATAPG